jgi:hypothetical protein
MLVTKTGSKLWRYAYSFDGRAEAAWRTWLAGFDKPSQLGYD